MKQFGPLLLVSCVVLVISLLAIGYVKCWYKFVTCDFKEPYRAEVLYGIGAFTPLGTVIGWTNIDDDPIDKQ